MKYFLLFFLTLIVVSAVAQNQSSVRFIPYPNVLATQHSTLFRKSLLFPFLSPDRQLTYRPKSPQAMTVLGSTSLKGENYWMGSMTTQSYNQGKMGTYYLWDMQGNLRESRMFVDIAGKNKRGLKLVFRRR